MNDMNNGNLICCPKCGAEYYPSEIFYPKYFLGDKRDIEKDYSGHIIYSEGIDQDTNEWYICDKCKTKFYATANISYVTSLNQDEDINTPYTSSLYEDRLYLTE